MPEYKKPKPCADCGKPTTYRNRNGRCRACGMRALRECYQDRINKKGPYYKKWVKGMLRGAKRLKKESEKRVA